MTLLANHPLSGNASSKVYGKMAIAVFYCSFLLLLMVPRAVFGQDAINPLASDTSKPAQGGTNLLKLQFEKASDFERKKDYKKAIETYSICIDNAPPASDVLKFALSRRATCYFKQKAYDLCLHDASLVPPTVIKTFMMVSSNDAVKLTVQYDHDAYILAGVCRVFLKPGLGCDDFKNALTIEGFVRYKGAKNADTFIKKYCK